VVLPNKPLSNFELLEAVKKLKLKNFRGAFLRDTLPKASRRSECGILNLDNSSGRGTHWTAWYRKGDKKHYFDRFGLPPPTELDAYLRGDV